MKRRIICLFLAVILLVSLMPAAFAAGSGRTVEGRTETQAAEYLYALGLFKGTGTQADGSPVFDLNKTPTRN